MIWTSTSSTGASSGTWCSTSLATPSRCGARRALGPTCDSRRARALATQRAAEPAPRALCATRERPHRRAACPPHHRRAPQIRYPTYGTHAAVYLRPGFSLPGRAPPAAARDAPAAAAAAAPLPAAAAAPAAAPAPAATAPDATPQGVLRSFLRRRLAPARMQLRWKLEEEMNMRRAPTNPAKAAGSSGGGAVAGKPGGGGGGADAFEGGADDLALLAALEAAADDGDAPADAVAAGEGVAEDVKPEGAADEAEEKPDAAGGAGEPATSDIDAAAVKMEQGQQEEQQGEGDPAAEDDGALLSHLEAAASEPMQVDAAAAPAAAAPVAAAAAAPQKAAAAAALAAAGGREPKILDVLVLDPEVAAVLRQEALRMALEWDSLAADFESEHPAEARELWQNAAGAAAALRQLMAAPAAPCCDVEARPAGAEQAAGGDAAGAAAEAAVDGGAADGGAQRLLVVPKLEDALPASAPQWAASCFGAHSLRRTQLLASETAASGRDVAWLGCLVSRLRVLLLDYTPLAPEPLATPARPGLPLLPERGAPTSAARDLQAAVGVEAWRLAEFGCGNLEQLLASPVFHGSFEWAERQGRK